MRMVVDGYSLEEAVCHPDKGCNSLPAGKRLAPCNMGLGLSRAQILGAFATLVPIPSKRAIVNAARVSSGGPALGRSGASAAPTGEGGVAAHAAPRSNAFAPLAEWLESANEGASEQAPQRADGHQPVRAAMDLHLGTPQGVPHQPPRDPPRAGDRGGLQRQPRHRGA